MNGSLIIQFDVSKCVQNFCKHDNIFREASFLFVYIGIKHHSSLVHSRDKRKKDRHINYDGYRKNIIK